MAPSSTRVGGPHLPPVANQKVVLFPEGPGYIFVSKLAGSALAKVMLVRSLKDSKLYVRKESLSYSWNPSQIIQSPDVNAMKQVQRVDDIATLLGWTEYQDEVRSNNVVTATYWQLYDCGTLEELKDRISENKEPVSEKFFLSLFHQMLRIMLESIRSGILHTDTHAGNWFLSLVNEDKIVRPVLGDWNLFEGRPNMKEHGEQDWARHNPDCELCR